ncbi:hypothetical protein PEDI_25220 [Persicobacter diffluens]|uniref:Uncharacterized protein n=1 Tax=Persicobacter diffluens TaxID=981 RepID=A0AAN4W133_9BACT|nr:hypothetical protein PEDI_25220 [Persicobacter diffluens]
MIRYFILVFLLIFSLNSLAQDSQQAHQQGDGFAQSSKAWLRNFKVSAGISGAYWHTSTQLSGAFLPYQLIIVEPFLRKHYN